MKYALLPAVLCLLLLSAALPADVIYLIDGSKREGKILETTDTEIVLEMTVGGLKAAARFPRAQVARIEKGQTPVELQEAEFAKRRAALKPGDLDAMEELARWCVTGALYTQATELYQEMATKGDAGFKRGKLGLSRMEFDRGRLATAIVVSDELKKKLPEDKDVLAWAEELRKARENDLTEAVRSALAQSDAGKPERALKMLEGLIDRMSLEDTRAAFSACRVVAGNPDVLDYMATLRMERKCTFCKEGGIICKDCKGSGKTEQGWLCPVCKGLGSNACTHCNGTGIMWDSVQPEEKPSVLKLLNTMADLEDATLADIRTKFAKADISIADIRGLAGDVLYRSRRADTLRGWAATLTADKAAKEGLAAKRRADLQLTADVLMIAGTKLEGIGKDKFKEADQANASLMRNDQKVREAHALLQQAEAYYKWIDADKVRLSEDPRKIAKQLHETVAGMEVILNRNSYMAQLYANALAAARAEKLADSLRFLEELVTKAPRLDMDFIAEGHKKNFPLTLAESMAKMRFELGKDRRNGFSPPTDYDKAAFAELLISEAGAKAREAQQHYDNINAARALGRGVLVPGGAVSAVQHLAEDARNWYEALLIIKYPLREQTVLEVKEAISQMNHIIDRCRSWFVAPAPTPTPTR